jgi:tRNA A-37 threonylcarbamoyl transferase component Bud32
MIQPRHFHQIDVIDNHVVKTANGRDLDGEIYFYHHIPPMCAMYFPMIVSVGINPLQLNEKSIVMEKIDGHVMSHLLITRSLTIMHIRTVIEVLRSLHSTVPVETGLNIYANWYMKIKHRYKHHIDVYDALVENPTQLKSFIYMVLGQLQVYHMEQSGVHVGCIHGDPVLTNLIWTGEGVKMIDMRGSVGNRYTIEGDMYYDWSKLYQSLWGYDFIILDRPMSMLDHNYLQQLRTYVIETTGLSEILLNRLVVAHLISIIPMHTNRAHQLQFLQLAYQIYRYNAGIESGIDSDIVFGNSGDQSLDDHK